MSTNQTSNGKQRTVTNSSLLVAPLIIPALLVGAILGVYYLQGGYYPLWLQVITGVVFVSIFLTIIGAITAALLR